MHNIADHNQYICHESTDLVHPWIPEGIDDNVALASANTLP
jgi:hypothetical protein